MEIPENLRDESDEDGTVSIFLPDQNAVTLRLSLLTFRAKDGSISAGKGADYVRERAGKEGRNVQEIGGWPASTEHKELTEDGTPIEMDYWYIGGDESLAIISLTTVAAARSSSAARFFRKHLPCMLESIKFTQRVEFIETNHGTFPTRVTSVDPVPQNVEDFGPAERIWLSASIIQAQELAIRYAFPMESNAMTPEILDQIFARWLSDDACERPADRIVADALGAAFGEALVRSLGMRWVAVSDDAGVAKAVRHEHGENTAFPVDSVLKRIESRETGFFSQIAELLRGHIENDSADA